MFQALVVRAYRGFGRIFPCDITRLLILDIATIPHLEIENTVQIRTVNSAELAKLAKHSANDISARLIADMQQCGFACIAAFEDNTLLGYNLYAEGAVPACHNSGGRQFAGIALQLPPDTHYLFKAFVLPQYRGRRLLSQLIYQSCVLLQAQGAHTIVTTTDWTNTSAVNAMQRAGFNIVGLAGELVVAGKSFFYLPGPLTLPGPGNPSNASTADTTKRGVIRLGKP